jgi:hypothetical protein
MDLATHREAGKTRIARACWVDADLPDDLAPRCAAVLQTSAEFTVVAVTTAARIHDLWLPAVPDEVHLATATPGRAGRTMTRTRRPEFVPHRFQLRAGDITVIGGVLVTSLARTWRDLAAVLDLPQVVAAGDSALRLGATEDELADAISVSPRRPHTRLARAALSLLDARSKSRPESHMRVAISAPELPRFEVNESVYRDDGGWLGEPDLSLDEAKLGLEYQGADHAKVRQMRRDLTRFKDFRDERWLMLPYGPAQTFKRPWEIRGEVHAAVAERAPHLLRPSRRVVI